MLKKLLKYDLKNLYKSLLPIYLIGILLSIFSKVLSILADKWVAFSIVNGFVFAFYIMSIFVIPAFCLFIIVTQYYKSIAKDEGYLTHTLPVKKTSIVNSKIISAVITLITTLLVVAIGLFIRIGNMNVIGKAFKELYSILVESFGIEFIIILCALSFIGLISYINDIFTAIGLGQMHNNNKGVMAFVYTIAIYYVNQIITAIFLVVPTFFSDRWQGYLEMDLPPKTFINGYLLFALALEIILMVIYYIINVKVLKNKLNLE